MLPPPPPPARRSPRRFWRTVGLCFLGLIVLLAALYREEDWRGARAWAACQRDLEARGEILAWNAFIPPPVPDEQNLAMSPLFVRELHYHLDPKSGVYTFGDDLSASLGGLRLMPYGGEKPQSIHPAGWDLPRRTDLAGFQRYYRQKEGFPHPDTPQSPAADVLLALTRYAPALDELSQAAAARPLTRFPINWHTENAWGIRLPHLNLEQELVTTLCLRASAQLAAGHSADALPDLELSLRLCRDMRSEGFLISYLVESTCVRFLLTAVWEGLADRRWSAAELARLQADLQRLDLLADYLSAIRGERVFGIQVIDYLASRRDALALITGVYGPFAGGGGTDNFFTRNAGFLIPRGWFELNKVALVRFQQDYVLPTADVKAHRVYLDKEVASSLAMEAMPRWPTNVLARTALPIMGSIGSRAALAQTGLDEAVAACALERFFLDHQAYPARLGELVPAYLEHVPTDVIDGAPLRYSLTPDGRYQLYGIGWNGRDDGGRVVLATSGRLDPAHGDWVWKYAELPPVPLPKAK